MGCNLEPVLDVTGVSGLPTEPGVLGLPEEGVKGPGVPGPWDGRLIGVGGAVGWLTAFAKNIKK